MKIIKTLFIFFTLGIVLNSCGVGKVLRNEKITSSDEFLIEKKGPLTQPPDFNTILEPGTTANKAKKENTSIEKMMQSQQSKNTNAKKKASNIEESILNQIKK